MTIEETAHYKDYEKHKGEIVITGCHDIALLYGFVSDEEDDSYVFSYYGKLQYHSCCVGFIPLKNKIKDSDYEKLIYRNFLNYVEYDKIAENLFIIIDTIDNN